MKTVLLLCLVIAPSACAEANSAELHEAVAVVSQSQTLGMTVVPTCWTGAYLASYGSCAHGRNVSALTLDVLNCHLEESGRSGLAEDCFTHPAECTAAMDNYMFGVYTQFRTSAESFCHRLQRTQWEESAVRAIEMTQSGVDTLHSAADEILTAAQRNSEGIGKAHDALSDLQTRTEAQEATLNELALLQNKTAADMLRLSELHKKTSAKMMASLEQAAETGQHLTKVMRDVRAEWEVVLEIREEVEKHNAKMTADVMHSHSALFDELNSVARAVSSVSSLWNRMNMFKSVCTAVGVTVFSQLVSFWSGEFNTFRLVTVAGTWCLVIFEVYLPGAKDLQPFCAGMLVLWWFWIVASIFSVDAPAPMQPSAQLSQDILKKSLEKAGKDELKAELERLGIPSPVRAKKGALVELLLQAK